MEGLLGEFGKKYTPENSENDAFGKEIFFLFQRSHHVQVWCVKNSMKLRISDSRPPMKLGFRHEDSALLQTPNKNLLVKNSLSRFRFTQAASSKKNAVGVVGPKRIQWKSNGWT